MDESLPKIKSAPLTIVAVSRESASNEGWDELAFRSFLKRSPAGSQLVLIDPNNHVTNMSSIDWAIVISDPAPGGFGPALRQVARAASAPLVCFVPADKALSPDDTASLLAQIDDAHLVIGCRRTGPIPFVVLCRDLAVSIASVIFLGYYPEARLGWPGWTGWGRRLIARRLFGVPLLDPETNIVLARREIFERIPLQSTGTFAFVELAAKANHLGYRLAEVGVEGRAYAAENFGADARRVFRDPDFGPPPAQKVDLAVK